MSLSENICKAWNARNPVGKNINYVADSGELLTAKIVGEAKPVNGVRCAKIKLKGASTYICLDRLITI